MKRAILAAFTLASVLSPLWITPAAAQQSGQASVVSSCGSASYPAGTVRPTTQDTTGTLCAQGGGGGGSNPAAGPTGSAVPADASYNGLNVGGTLLGQTGVNPSGSIYAAQTDMTTVNGVATQTGAGAVGTGSQRVAVGQDTTTIAGSAPGTAGTPSTNVMSVQGVASGTNLPTSVPNGANIVLGNNTDSAACTSGTSLVACARQLHTDATSAIPAGTNTIGGVTPVASASGGATTFTLTAANSTNATNVKASAGTLYHIAGYNNSATLAWISFYNTSGTPTCGTSIVYQTMIPANSTSGAGAVEDFATGLNFSTGIGICVTTGIAGTGSVAASAYVIGLGIK